MGQAKLRGNFEERKAAGIKKQEDIIAERKRLEAEHEASLTPEQRAKREGARKLVTTIVGMGAGSLNRSRRNGF